MKLATTFYRLGVEGVDEFVALLTTPLRRLPVVLLTTFAGGHPSDLDAASLAQRLVGVAVVTQATNADTTRALSETLGKLGCYDGGVRIYWPGFGHQDDIRRHPLLFGSRIAAIGPVAATRRIERLVFAAATFRFTADQRIDEIVNAVEAGRRTERAIAVREGTGATWEQYAMEMAADNDALKAQLEEAKLENTGLKVEIDNFRDNQAALGLHRGTRSGRRRTEQRPRPGRCPGSCRFRRRGLQKLGYLGERFASARRSPFCRPLAIYEALHTLDESASVWKRNKGGDLKQMLVEGGLGRRINNFVSHTSKGKYKDDYTFTYKGVPTLFEPHVTLGAGSADTCASIHFMADAESEKVVIAHVGRHLTNTKS